VVGTPYYLSPEVVQSNAYTNATDIWSMGVILYEMVALKPPFDGQSLQMLAMKIVRGAYNPITGNYSAPLKGLIKDCLSVAATRRPTVNQILKMPLI
jgi:NIMA (never in mitosis gene a)-related kinase